MEHYKLDWHRFNLRQKLAGLLPVTVEEFERKTGAGEKTHPHMSRVLLIKTGGNELQPLMSLFF